MPVRTLELTEEVPEKVTVRYKGKFVDEDGVAITSSSMSAIKLTMYLQDTTANTIIGDWDAKSVLNENGGTYGSADGILTLYLGPTDTAMINSTRSRERHRLDFEFTYNSGTRTGRHTALLIIRNYGSVS